MADFDVKVVDHTNEVISAKDLAIEAALEIIGGKMEKYAKALCPVGTPESTGIPGYMGGTLRNSITYVTSTHAGKTVTIPKGKAIPTEKNHGGEKTDASTDEKEVVIVGTNVYYAPYVERGTTKKAPRRFIEPALKDHMSEYKHILANELKKV